jgi:predicted alpha-1,2-mannosidase
MTRWKFIFIFLSTLMVACQLSTDKEPVDYVDLLLGTSSSRWMLYPGPSMPFGMVKLSPDNSDEWAFDAGYEYTIKSIAGFGHVHSWAVGSFLTMPTTGAIKILPGRSDDPDAGYRSRFSHKNEKASPGYYTVFLDDYEVKAELTATTRSGFQRYTFPKTSQAHVLFDLQIPEEMRTEIIAAQIEKVNDLGIAGYVKRVSGWNEYTLHFVARFNRPFDSISCWKGSDLQHNIERISVSQDMDIGALVHFSTENDPIVLMKTGISFVSIDQARLNMEEETSAFGWDFEAVHQNARKTWNELLSKIEVEGGSETDKVKFYTNMYRSYCARTIFSDVNGKYADMCENIVQLEDPDSPVFGCDAFWNTFWNLNQLWSLVTPDIANQWVKSLLEIYDRGGWLSKGPGGIEYSSIMVASHEIPLIVGAYQKGIRNYDVEKAYQAIKEIQMNPGRAHECGGHVGNHNLKSYLEIGFVPAEEGPVSNTLEYAFDDWCVAQMAKSLGKTDHYKYFMNRSQYYKNVYDHTTGYVRPKYRGGPWLKDFVPIVKAAGKEDNFGGKDYVEGNAWQFSWFVPHDVPGLIDMMGLEEFNRRLDEGFELSRPNFVSQFVNHSNQPNMQPAHLFNYSGKPWRTQYWVREILDNYYGTGPVNGYPGDEDQGQMGAWYVMNAIGLFQMDGGASTTPVYEIGSPLFEKITIHLDENYYSGKKFVIEAKNTSKENRYVQSATLNGKSFNTFWFYHKDLVNGGELVVEMGSSPNKQWGTAGGLTRPIDIDPIVTTPYVNSEERLFLDKAQISLACDTKDAKIYYTLNGSAPDKNSLLFVKPITINKTSTIKMRAFVGNQSSLTTTAVIEKAKYQSAVKPGVIMPGISYNYYSGIFSRVSDFNNMPREKSGILSHFSLEPRDKEQYFGLDYKGFIKVPSDGLYTFYLKSNDGSKMYLGGSELINNDGGHPVIERFETIALKAGFHEIIVKYFQEGGTHHLQLGWSGPGFKKVDVPADVLFYKDE